LFWVVVVLMVIIGTPFVVIDPEAGVWVVVTLAGTALLIAIVAFLVPRLAYRRNIGRPSEVMISPEGICVGGQLTVWKTLTSRLDRVTLSGQDPALLEFEVSYLSRISYQTYEVRVPVPPGQEALAEQVVAALAPRRSRGHRRGDAQQTSQKE